MCSTPKAPQVDQAAIDRQEAEARRQRDEDWARQQQLQAQQLAEAERQRQLQLQLAAEQTAREKAFQDEQRRVQEEQRAREAAERAAAEAAAKDRASQVSTYNAGRQDRLSKVEADINSAFGGFDDGYYNKFEQDFIGYYKPQVGKQYDDAVRQSTLDFANTGNIESSAYNRRQSQLAEKRAEEEARIANEAASNRAKLRGDIDSAKSNLLGQARSGAFIGPDDAPTGWDAINGTLGSIDSNFNSLRSTAQQRADGLRTASQYQPLGDVFKSLLVKPGGAATGKASMAAQQPGNFVAPLTDQGLRIVGG